MPTFQRLELVAIDDGLQVQTSCAGCGAELRSEVGYAGVNPFVTMLHTAARTVQGIALEFDGAAIVCPPCDESYRKLGVGRDAAAEHVVRFRVVTDKPSRTGASWLPSGPRGGNP
jgi:hypothetical protein